MKLMDASGVLLGGYIPYRDWEHNKYNFYRISTHERGVLGRCSYDTMSINRYYNSRKLNNIFYNKYDNGSSVTVPLNKVGFFFTKSRMFESFSFYILIL